MSVNRKNESEKIRIFIEMDVEQKEDLSRKD